MFFGIRDGKKSGSGINIPELIKMNTFAKVIFFVYGIFFKNKYGVLKVFLISAFFTVKKMFLVK
jgi:hypothetical protein